MVAGPTRSRTARASAPDEPDGGWAQAEAAEDAEAALSEAGVKDEAEAGPFAALAALKGEPKG